MISEPAISTSLIGRMRRAFSVRKSRKLADIPDKGSADVIEGLEVQWLAIPAHGKMPSAATSRREVRRRSRAGHPHFNVARACRFDPVSTLIAINIEGIDRRCRRASWPYGSLIRKAILSQRLQHTAC